MTADGFNVADEGKTSSNTGLPFLQSILATAKNFLKTALVDRGACPFADRHIMKNFNGSDCMFNQHGFISDFRDSEGRHWSFTYSKEKVVAFSDPHGHSFTYDDTVFIEDSGKFIDPTPLDVSVNHTTGEVTIIDAVRVTRYRPDGSTVINVEQVRNGEVVRVCFTEYATSPHRAFVVVEERGGRQLVTWVQDANAKLFKFEHDANGNLAKYSDVSHKPAVVWSVETTIDGKVTSWSGIQKSDGKAVGNMSPMLESIDLCGNRHFVRQDGARFVVGPSGAACLSSHLQDDVIAGNSAVVTFAASPNFSPDF
jgi:hypothetical protein